MQGALSCFVGMTIILCVGVVVGQEGEEQPPRGCLARMRNRLQCCLTGVSVLKQTVPVVGIHYASTAGAIFGYSPYDYRAVMEGPLITTLPLGLITYIIFKKYEVSPNLYQKFLNINTGLLATWVGSAIGVLGEWSPYTTLTCSGACSVGGVVVMGVMTRYASR